MLFPKKQNSKCYQKGFGLIETLVGTAIFVTIAISTYQVFTTLMEAVSLSRVKITATALANEQFEIIRNLPYVDVGITGGIPSGRIQRNQTLTRDNHSFTVVTTIRNIDDPFDGTIGGTPSDLSPADYKLADLDITCTNCKTFPPLNFTTLVAPRALETSSINGALFVRVYNSSGVPVQGTTLHIVNTQTNPDTIIDETTDNDGWLKIIDAAPGVEAYNIIATKNGYSTDQTYPINGPAGADPLKLDATIVTKQVTQLSFSIDKLSSFLIETIDPICAPAPDINFSLTGTKLIGNPAILKYPIKNFATDATGTISIPSLEWDSYVISQNGATYDIAGTIPINSISLLPDESKQVKIIAVPHVANSLLISITDTTGLPIDGANVILQKTSFDENKTTSDIGCLPPGQVFWNGLDTDTYNLTISKQGYVTYTNTITVNNIWKNFSVILDPV